MTRFLCATLATAALIVTASSTAAAQTAPSSAPRWWFGGYVGANYNFFGGQLHDLDALWRDVAPPDGFTSGSGLGATLGGLVEYRYDDLLGGLVMLGYDNRSVDPEMTPVAGYAVPTLSTALSYLSLEPNLRVNLPWGALHLLAGPGVAINLERGFEMTTRSTSNRDTLVEGELTDVRSLVLGAQIGLGYDLDLRDILGASALATPMAQLRFGQGPLDPPAESENDFGLTSIRLGVQLKFGSEDNGTIVRGEDLATFDFMMRVPRQIVASRRINETFPLRNDLFFDEGATELPARYPHLAREAARNFHEKQLTEQESPTGRTPIVGGRERRQMMVYYNALNILGDRMREQSNARIRLVGAGNGNAERGLAMAASVRDYLVGSFGIAPERIAIEGQAMPTAKSGTGVVVRGEDAQLIAQENNRVTFDGPPEIMRPVRIVSVQEEPLTNDVVFTLPSDSLFTSWSVELTSPGGAVQMFGPFSGATGRVSGKPLLANMESAEFTARVIGTDRNGYQRTSGTRGFRLQRGIEEELAADRYSILFEFDDSRTVKTYERFLTETVAPAIPHASVIVVHGHTDQIGDVDYNARLSQNRANETQKVLSDELQKQGKFVTFDSYGFGEDEERAPFDNTMPEKRYYNRTVVIEVVQGE